MTKTATLNAPMIKLESADQEDLCYSVNPHLAQPTFEDLLIERNSERSYSQSPEDCQPLPSVDGSVRMEHCINLDLYLAPIHDTMESCYTDELDTPDTFVSAVRNDLNKIINTTTHQKQSDGNPFNFSATAAQPIAVTSAKTTTANTSVSKTTNMINFTLGKDNIQNHKIAEAIDEMMAGDCGAADCGGLLSPNHFEMEDINLNEYDFLLDCQDAIDADDMINDVNVTHRNNSNADNASMDINNATHAAPVNAATAINELHNYALKLNIENLGQLLPQGDIPHTPDIISTILQFENNPNIKYDIVTIEEIKEELPFSPQSDPSPQPPTPDTVAQDDESSMQSIASSSTAALSAKVTNVRARRRKQDTDDEDYVPPSMTPRKPIKRRLNIPIKVEDSDDDEEEYTPAKLPKRGRPAKPVSARSSESSESSKYREMRDKNNEASRRSRRKRRIQELVVEDECEQLNDKNVRLKAQVSELEKSVAVYRGNLMSLLLNKS